MKFTLDWLKEYTDIDGLTPDELAEHLTMLGLEVDSVTPLFEELSALKTATVIETAKHPNADKLTVCKVAVGDDTLKIVCGAPNVREGLCTVVAVPGTVLPGNFKIKKSKVRGEESFGMLCSEKELGLGDSHSGIMELPEGTPHGQSFVQTMGLADTLVEVDLTPNRPDCASVIGTAREIASVTRKPLTLPVENAEINTISQHFSVDIESSELCPRYAARLITNVTVAPSPWWLRKRLMSIGLRPINNVVDITNFVMMEYGQPLHAFDFANLADSKIIVRCPREEEKTFTTLDGTERKIDKDTLMICDGKQPVAVAGVMGGLNSEVSEDTTSVLLESACFNAVSVRKTARKLGISTDASYRFERGVDPGGVCNAMNRAVELLCEVAGGTAENDGADVYLGRAPMNTQTIRTARTSELLGIDLDKATIRDHLESIGFRCEDKDEDTLWVNPPTFRVDIEREADLVEEIARLVGYNNIPISLPAVNLSYPEQDSARNKRCETASFLASIGFSEAINYSFCSEKHSDQMALIEDDSRRQVVNLLNPLTEDQSVMRTMLIPGLLENVKRNLNYNQYDAQLFELGIVFTPTEKEKQPIETMMLSGVITGNRFGNNSPLYFKAQQVDIFDIKGGVEALLKNLRLLDVGDDKVHFHQPTEKLSLEPFADPDQFLQVFSGDTLLGSLGKCTIDVLKNFGIKQDVYYFELNYEKICEVQKSSKAFTSLPVFPAVKRDIALLLPNHVSSGELLETVGTSKDKLIESYDIFDVYQGKSIKEGFKSVAISITYRSATKTLTDKNVEKSHNKIVKLLTNKFEGSFRE